jgi:hypothetical protein
VMSITKPTYPVPLFRSLAVEQRNRDHEVRNTPLNTSGTTSLKALAIRVLERNTQRNTIGTTAENLVPQPRADEGVVEQHFGHFCQAAEPCAKAVEHTEQLSSDDFEERAATVEFDGGFPREWAEGFARLDPDHPPAGVPPKRWLRFVDDVGLFLDHWAAKASALGWGPEDLFGAHPRKPFERIECAGLLWLINGARVVAVSADTAIVETADGARQSYRRTSDIKSRAMAWELPRS